MIYSIFKKSLKYLALEKGKFGSLYIRLCRPDHEEFNVFLRKQSGIHFIGKNTEINTDVNITDPPYVSIGDNCTLSSCTLIGHDGVIRILNNVYGKKLDSVGKIVIKDNCFIGMGAIIMPNVTIGPNSVVAAGSIVTKDVMPGTIVGGVPAKVIGSMDALAERLEAQTKALPWNYLIEQRVNAFDPAMEPELMKLRVKHFFG